MQKSNNVAKKQHSSEKILGSRNKIKILRFLTNNPDWQFNLSNIASQINVHKGAVSKIVREFEANSILNVRRNGKLLLFKLNEEHEIISKLIMPFFKKEEKLR